MNINVVNEDLIIVDGVEYCSADPVVSGYCNGCVFDLVNIDCRVVPCTKQKRASTKFTKNVIFIQKEII